MLRAFVAVLGIIGSAALAQVSTMENARPTVPRGDPDQLVCISETVTGSRLGTRRVCRTRAEWAEHRSQTRGVVEKVQFFKPTCGGPCGDGPG
jgi:hypothetical protein